MTRTQADREDDWAVGRELERKDAKIARLRAELETERASQISAIDGMLAAEKEVARLCARPTEEEITRVIIQGHDELWTDRAITRRILALFPKVQP